MVVEFSVEGKAMNSQLAQAIRMLNIDRQVAALRVDDYWDLQKRVSAKSAGALHDVAENYRVLERRIVGALSVLRTETVRSH